MDYDVAEQQVFLEELYGICTSDEDDEEETPMETIIIEEAEELVAQLDVRVFEQDTFRVCELISTTLKEKKFVVAGWLVGKILPPINLILVEKIRSLKWGLLADWLETKI